MARRPNDDIADRLDEIAALLEAQAANRFRVRAYRRAATTLRQLVVPASQTHDWVVLYCDDGPRDHQWTIITAAFGPLQGRRIVTGRETECAAWYATAAQELRLA